MFTYRQPVRELAAPAQQRFGVGARRLSSNLAFSS
jgi:hypothetical protein